VLRCDIVRAVFLVLLLGVAAGAEARPLSLADALALARMRRSEMAQARIDVRRAQLNVLRAALERARLTVQVTAAEQAQQLNINGTRAAACPPGFPTSSTACAGEAHNYAATASLVVPLWSGLTVEADLAGARARAHAATAAERATANSIGLDAAMTYWEVRRADLDLEVAQQAAARTREIEKMARMRVDAHIAPEVDYARAHVQTMRQAQAEAQLESQLGVASAQLGLALQLDEPAQPIDDPRVLLPSLPPLGDAEAEALHARADLAGARAVVESDRQLVRAAKGAYWPQLSLVGQAGVADNVLYAPTPETPIVALFGGLQLNWLIFDGLTTWTAVKDAGYVRDRAALELDRLGYQVRADVRAAHGKLAAALKRRAAAIEAAQSAARALFLLQKRYQVGDALLLELILAQQDLTQADGDLNDISIDAVEAHAQLQAAIGRL
jgi:outer membrane protein TolC